MIIVKCSECGTYMHKNDRCYICGNTKNFDTIFSDSAIHSNVRFEFEKLETLISNGKFEEALVLSNDVLEWMPNFSSAFWLKLLAKNHCKNDEELIKKGFSYSESAEYYNACKYANEHQKEIYEFITKIIEDTKNNLLNKIDKIEYREKELLPVIQYSEEIPVETEKFKNRLFSLWSDLRKIESNIISTEMDCKLLHKECETALLSTKRKADLLEKEVAKLTECPEDDFHNYKIQFSDLLYLTEQAIISIDFKTRPHPWVTEYQRLVNERNKVCSEIAAELNKMKDYQTKIKAVISSIEKIEEKSQKAKNCVEKYEFIFAKKFLGETEYSDAFLKAGVR